MLSTCNGGVRGFSLPSLLCEGGLVPVGRKEQERKSRKKEKVGRRKMKERKKRRYCRALHGVLDNCGVDSQILHDR